MRVAHEDRVKVILVGNRNDDISCHYFGLSMLVRSGKSSDIEEILALQERNLYSNLSELERANGFVTTLFTTSQIEDLLDEQGIFVAEKNAHIIGYAYAGSWQYGSVSSVIC